jgi:sugar phosphate isomerase/epimerase
MINRRNFLRTASAFAAGSMLLPASLSAKGINPYDIGLQLYTLRTSLERDFSGTLAQLARIGYRQVELYGYDDGKYFGLTVKEVKELLFKYRLRAPSGHYAYGLDEKQIVGSIRNNWEQAIEDARSLGHKYMVLAYLTDKERERLDQYKTLAEWLNMAGQQCQHAGIQLCYHNHDFEFQPLEGELPYDILLSNTEPSLVKMELDLYWITKAGKDPLAYFEAHPGRFPLWHVKDMTAPPANDFAEVGSGIIDFPALFAQQNKAGLKQFFVEQDQSKRNPFASIQMSYEYLSQMKY